MLSALQAYKSTFSREWRLRSQTAFETVLCIPLVHLYEREKLSDKGALRQQPRVMFPSFREPWWGTEFSIIKSFMQLLDERKTERLRRLSTPTVGILYATLT